MTEAEQRIAIAELCGWKFDRASATSPHARLADTPVWFRETDSACMRLPDYLHDWTAIREAVNSLPENRIVFLHHLNQVTLRRSKIWFPERIVSSTLSEWCEAFLRAHDKWKD